MGIVELLALYFGVRALIEGRFSLNGGDTYVTGALNVVVALLLLSVVLSGVAMTVAVLAMDRNNPLFLVAGVGCLWDFIALAVVMLLTASFAETEYRHEKKRREREGEYDRPRSRKNRAGKRRFEDFDEEEGGERPRRRRSRYRDDDEDD